MTNFDFGVLNYELNRLKENGLTFEDKQLTWDTAEDVNEVVQALNDTKLVHYLKLEGNTLGVEAASAIGKALEPHSEFKKAFWRNLFTRRLKSEIPEALKHLGNGLIVANAHLTVLDLSDNALGPNGMVGLESLLRSPVCYSLLELRLTNCGLGIGGGEMLSEALLDCHSKSTSAGSPLKLKIFSAGRNRLENDGAKAIAKIFSTLKSLEEIAMPQNSIYYEGIAELSKSFKQNPNLQIINLNDNTVRQEGASFLAEAFSYTPNLKEINFGDCILMSSGAYLFAKALEEKHTELKTVDLSFNEIDASGGEAIILALRNKLHLEKLNLDGNQFGCKGRTRIKEEALTSLANPSALENLDEDQSESEDEMYDDEQHDTTEEADEYEYCENEDDADETAYKTSEPFTTNMFNQDESWESQGSVQLTKIFSSFSNDLTTEKFCLNQSPCSLQMFESLKDENVLESFKRIFKLFSGENYLLVLIFTTLKCAHLSKLSENALILARQLFKESFDYAVNTNQELRLLEFYLKQLGFIGNEERVPLIYNQNNCRFALQETLTKEKISSDFIRSVLSVFFKK